MRIIGVLAAWALGILTLSGAEIILQPALWSSSLGSDLQPHLSPDASIFYPDSKNFKYATTRWQTYRDPTFSMVVEVATAQDVQTTVKYANQHRIPFLAVSGGHGAIGSLGSMHHGIQIWMRKLNTVQIEPDGKTALMGGGLLDKEITDALWAKGKQTGMLGVMLGGGHGWLQGRYGLVADQLVEAQMVLANGTLAIVSSTSHRDLFWAVRGAGHNFGIVTSFRFKVYDVPPNNIWTLESFVFTGDKVEQVYEATNNLAKKIELINFSYFIKIPSIDPENAVINYFLLYEGPPSEAAKYARVFHDLGPVNATSTVAQFPELASLTGNGNDDVACQHGYSALRFPASLVQYNIETQRIIYNKFNEIVSSQPAFKDSFFLFEGYSVQGVQAIPDKSTAFPDRYDEILVSPVLIYATNKSLDAQAIEAGKGIQTMLKDSTSSNRLHAYVNYAHGSETLEEMYGFAPWRLKHLRELKNRYDPQRRFDFYAPID